MKLKYLVLVLIAIGMMALNAATAQVTPPVPATNRPPPGFNPPPGGTGLGTYVDTLGTWIVYFVNGLPVYSIDWYVGGPGGTDMLPPDPGLT